MTIIPASVYAVKVAWSSARLPMACSNTTTSRRRLSSPHEASAPMIASSCIFTKPLWLSPRPWYGSRAQNVEAVVISMQRPVQVHLARTSFKRMLFTSAERRVFCSVDVENFGDCNCGSRIFRPKIARLSRCAVCQYQPLQWLLTTRSLMSFNIRLHPRPKRHRNSTTHTRPTRTTKRRMLIR